MQRGETAVPPPWPRDLTADEVINDWIYAREHGRPVDAVLEDADGAFTRLRSAVETLSEEDLTDPHRFPWLEGRALGDVLISRDYFAHLHEEHEPDLRAWLDRENSGSGGCQSRWRLRAEASDEAGGQEPRGTGTPPAGHAASRAAAAAFWQAGYNTWGLYSRNRTHRMKPRRALRYCSCAVASGGRHAIPGRARHRAPPRSLRLGPGACLPACPRGTPKAGEALPRIEALLVRATN